MFLHLQLEGYHARAAVSPPDTLLFLLRASGFQRVDMRASSPMSDDQRLARIPADIVGAPLAEAVNQNIDRLNALLVRFQRLRGDRRASVTIVAPGGGSLTNVQSSNAIPISRASGCP